MQRGDWQPGRMLPSEAQLVQRYGIARTTVRRRLGVRRTSAGLVRHRPPAAISRDAHAHRVANSSAGHSPESVPPGGVLTSSMSSRTARASLTFISKMSRS
ncbi:GntR family transcriptional regulator [Streptomyces caniscabiei]|nr:GntR family transcriptional regulator [Streptomyces caniscabiei]MDX2604199.1 GntR family transcriptional regulator [Streptomyces caniscabiei]MDX2739220.1 GntR family transcriptional regulator [Streptomyces caniscabiei]MDX2780855.1 GntR family transcriptional regulator [Streptomyces caniscabiei]